VALAKPYPGSVALEDAQISAAQIVSAPVTFQDAASLGIESPVEARSWFAVFTRSHHERAVWEYLRQQQIDSFLPTYSQVRQWTNRRRVTLQLPLFPNYVFARIGRRERSRVLSARGVLSLVGRSCDPTPLTDREIDSLRSGLALLKCEPHPFLVAGTKVRIMCGPLQGMEGVLLRTKNNLRVVLTVKLINQSIAVEVDAHDLEPVYRHQLVPSCHA